MKKLSYLSMWIWFLVSLYTALSAHGVEYKVVFLNSGGLEQTCAYGIGGGQQAGDGDQCALLWNGGTGNFVNLHPSGFDASWAYDASAGQQVGGGRYWDGEVDRFHALRWTGSADSAVDLHPEGFYETAALGCGGGQQMGYGMGEITGWAHHALMWSGSADSYVDLHPSGFDHSRGADTDGMQQVGWATRWDPWPPKDHAILWSGTAQSFVDLHPAGYGSSVALGVGDGQQVGYGEVSVGYPYDHALLWEGTAASVVDLHTDDYLMTQAEDVAGGRQVGWGCRLLGEDPDYLFDYRALLWEGSAESVVDLHGFLPLEYQTYGLSDFGYTSKAFGLDSQGNVVGAVYWMDRRYADIYESYAVMWQVVPEPMTLLLLGFGGLMLRKRNRINVGR